MWTLTIRSPLGKPHEYTLKPDKNTIGRKAGNDIVVTDISASRKHAELIYDQTHNTLTIIDLGSTNGTYVNRELLTKPRDLKHNDVIRIGEHIINVTHEESMTSDDQESSSTRAGLRMLDSVHAMNRDFVEHIQIGVGINTGTVVAGYMGRNIESNSLS